MQFCSGSHDVLFVLKLLRVLKKKKKKTCRRKRHTVGPKVALMTAFELFIEKQVKTFMLLNRTAATTSEKINKYISECSFVETSKTKCKKSVIYFM